MSSAASSRPGSCAVIVSPSKPGSVPGSRALSSSAVWNPVAAMPGNLTGSVIRFPDHPGASLAVDGEGGPRTVRSDGGSALRRGLPEADHVALRVLHVRGEAHGPDRLLRDDDRAAGPLDRGERPVDVLHV